MTNFKFEEIKELDNKHEMLMGSQSIVSNDLERIKKLSEIILKEFESKACPTDSEDLIKIDAYYTTIFVKYRRCFNSGKRKGQLKEKDVPPEYRELHQYLWNKANKYFAHAVCEDNKIAYQVNADTEEKVGISPILTSDLQPLSDDSLKKTITLVECLIKTIPPSKLDEVEI